MKVSPLKWIPLPVNPHLSPPRGLKDFQVGWFWNLFWASLQSEPLGYLLMSDDFWIFSGALTRERWEANSSAVLAAFEIVELSGHGRLLYFPPLKAIIEEQLFRLRSKKGTPVVVEDFNSFNKLPQSIASLSSVFDFDVGFEKERKKENESTRPKCEYCGGSGIRATGLTLGATTWCQCEAGRRRKSYGT